MLPPLYIPPKPDWKQIGPFQGPILSLGTVLSQAGHHLRSCHTQTAIKPDTSTPSHSFFVHAGSIVARVWSDHSVLLGQYRGKAILWHGTTFQLPTTVVPVGYKTENSKNHLTLKSVGKRLRPEGPADLLGAWHPALVSELHAWDHLLGPITHCGAPHTTGLVSPCYPFKTHEPSDIKTLLQDILITNQLRGDEVNLVVYGYQPETRGWNNITLEIWEANSSQQALKEKALSQAETILNDHFPFPKTHLIADPTVSDPLLIVKPGNPSAHEAIEAHRRLQKIWPRTVPEE